MKSFFIFLAVTLLGIGLFLAYGILHPTDTMMVRNGANWVVMERNVSQPRP